MCAVLIKCVVDNCLCVYYVTADYLEQAKKNLGCTTPGLVTTPKVAEKCFSSAPQQSKGTAPNTDEQSVESATHPKHSGLQRFQARIVSDVYHSGP